MAPTPADVEAYTKGRLKATDPEVVKMIARAWGKVRSFCGWHITPVKPETVTLDGTGYDWLILPTLKIVELVSVKEDGESIDLSTLRVKPGEGGTVYRRDGCWNPCSEYEIEFTHGFTPDEAADAIGEVLALLDAVSLTVGTGGMGPLTGMEVDDVRLNWSGIMDRSWGIAKNPLYESPLYFYRLRLPFA